MQTERARACRLTRPCPANPCRYSIDDPGPVLPEDFAANFTAELNVPQGTLDDVLKGWRLETEKVVAGIHANPIGTDSGLEPGIPFDPDPAMERKEQLKDGRSDAPRVCARG